MTDGKCEVWAPVQSPGGARDDIAKRLGVKPEETVTVHNTLLGGGFGRKSKCDFAIEAALLSKEMGGAPVKVVWTREDDIRHGFYHTVTAERLEAGLDADNKVVAWRHRSAAPTILSNFVPDPKHPQSTSSSAWAWSTRRSTCPTSAWRAARRRATCAIGWFRSVNNVAHAWSIQSFVAEIAHELGTRPEGLPARADRPGAHRRSAQAGHHAVVELRRAVRDLSDRHRTAAQGGRARGREGRLGHGSCRRARGSASPRIAASSATSPPWSRWRSTTRARSPSRASIRRSTAASAFNPERVRSQIEGAAVMGLTLAKYGEITLQERRASSRATSTTTRSCASTSRRRRRDVHIVEHGIDVPASGVGEPGVPPFAPALCNAIFAATGKRIRSLPIGAQIPT